MSKFSFGGQCGTILLTWVSLFLKRGIIISWRAQKIFIIELFDPHCVSNLISSYQFDLDFLNLDSAKAVHQNCAVLIFGICTMKQTAIALKSSLVYEINSNGCKYLQLLKLNSHVPEWSCNVVKFMSQNHHSTAIHHVSI